MTACLSAQSKKMRCDVALHTATIWIVYKTLFVIPATAEHQPGLENSTSWVHSLSAEDKTPLLLDLGSRDLLASFKLNLSFHPLHSSCYLSTSIRQYMSVMLVNVWTNRKSFSQLCMVISSPSAPDIHAHTPPTGKALVSAPLPRPLQLVATMEFGEN